MRSKIFNLVLLLIVSFIIFNLTSNIIRFWKKRGVLVQERQKLEALKNRSAELKLQLKYVQSEEFVEKEARDQLGLAKPGEEVWVLPEVIKDTQETEDSNGVEEANWQKWVRLFIDIGR